MPNRLGPHTELLAVDPRPTIVIDLEDPVTKDVFKFSSCNEALITRAAVRDEVFRIDAASSAFLEWIQKPSSFDPGESYTFAGLKWIKFTVAERWRVVSTTTPFQDVLLVPEELKVPTIVVSQENITLCAPSISPAVVEISHVSPEPEPRHSHQDLSRPDHAERAHSAGDIGQTQTEEQGHIGVWSDNFHQLLKAMMRDDRIAAMTTIGMFDFLPNGKLLQANNCWYETSGHSKDPTAATEFSFMDRVYQDDKDLVQEKWDMLAKGVPVTFEMRWKPKPHSRDAPKGEKAGEPTWVSAACVPFVTDNGTLVSISGFTTDITAQKQSQQHHLDKAAAIGRAEMSELRFARFAELAPVAVWIVDQDYQITYGNDKYFETIGSPRVPYETLSWGDSVHPEDLDSIIKGLDNLKETRTRQDFEFRLNRPWYGGDDIVGETWVTASGYPDFAPDGSIKEILGTMSDISRYKWAESVQRRRVEEVLELKRQQENFIDMTSHEIRNPISAVIQSADLISTSLYEMSTVLEAVAFSDIDTNELNTAIESNFEAVQTIIACSIHQKRIVDDILTLSKLDSRLLLITPVKVQAVDIIKDTLKMSKAEAQVADVKITYHEDPSLSILGIDWVMMDSSRVIQIFVNLLTNSIKFTQMAPKREVTVTVAASTSKPTTESDGYIPTKTIAEDLTQRAEWGNGDIIYLRFVVADTGRGLTPAEMKKLFFRFSQASPRTHVEYGGSGLGLFVSRELAELQGGQISVVSTFNVGSTFSFYIKCRKASSSDTYLLSPTPTPISGIKYNMKSPRRSRGNSVIVNRNTEAVFSLKGYRVLLVEDNIVNQRVLRKQLVKIGAEVEVAGHGLEALEKIAETTWQGGSKGLDVVLMDLEMPVMGGLECVRKVRAMQKEGVITGHLPVVVVSANARERQVEQAKEAGGDEFVSKPFRIGELVPRIMVLVGDGGVGSSSGKVGGENNSEGRDVK